jgi:hypothetical protein
VFVRLPLREHTQLRLTMTLRDTRRELETEGWKERGGFLCSVWVRRTRRLDPNLFGQCFLICYNEKIKSPSSHVGCSTDPGQTNEH